MTGFSVSIPRNTGYRVAGRLQCHLHRTVRSQGRSGDPPKYRSYDAGHRCNIHPLRLVGNPLQHAPQRPRQCLRPPELGSLRQQSPSQLVSALSIQLQNRLKYIPDIFGGQRSQPRSLHPLAIRSRCQQPPQHRSRSTPGHLTQTQNKLLPHSLVTVRLQCRNSLQHLGRPHAQLRFQQLHRQRSHTRIPMPQARLNRRQRLRIRLLLGQHRQRRQSLSGGRTLTRTDPPQCRQHPGMPRRLSNAMLQQPLRRVTPPPVDTAHTLRNRHQIQCFPVIYKESTALGICLTFDRRLFPAAALVGRNNAINAAPITAGIQRQLALILRRNPLRMLNHRTIHVRNPHGSIRPGPQHRGTKPVVFRCHKL